MRELNCDARRLGLLLGSRRCRRAIASVATDVQRGTAGQKRDLENIWREFFSDPSQWWDHRFEKLNERYPDFKHKKTHDALWLNGKYNPPWVEAELAVMEPGTLHMSIFSLNTRLTKYVKAREYTKALNLFQEMLQKGVKPDRFTFIQVLNAYGGLRALQDGRRIHKDVMQSGLESDVYVRSTIVSMYLKCGSIEDARSNFDKWHMHEVGDWNAMILGYIKCGKEEKALELFKQMQQNAVEPAIGTFLRVLTACASLTALEEGRLIHKQIIQRGLESDVFLGSSLIDMYAKCGSIEDASRVFNRMPVHSVVSWNIIILGHVNCGKAKAALDLYKQMQGEGLEPVSFTFVAVLNACASIAALEEGKCIHDQIIRKGCESDVFVGSSIVNMYAKCGSIDDAQRVFDKLPRRDVVSWGAMIQGHVKCCQGKKALELSRQMRHEGVEPDPVTFVGVLNACASVGALEEGKYIHGQIIQRGWESNVYLGSSLVDMYSKCESMENAWSVFNKMPSRSVVSWNTIVLGYLKCGQGQKALELYRQMNQEGVQMEPATFVGVLRACASVEALEEGKCVHEHLNQIGYVADMSVSNSLVDMYAKCGSIEDACTVFKMMPVRNVVSWNAMLGGYAIHGHANEALGHFECMCQEGVEMSMVTFVSLLSACNHGGLVDEGLHYFQIMMSVYGIPATVEHYACIVDVLCRAGRLHEAMHLIDTMSCEPDVAVWMSLLGACNVHGNLEIGRCIAGKVVNMEPGNSAGYVLLSNMYAAARKWDSCTEVNRKWSEGFEESSYHSVEVNKRGAYKRGASM